MATSSSIPEPTYFPSQQVLILFAYNNYVTNSGKYVMGIYHTFEEAMSRIIYLCEKVGYRTGSPGVFYSSDGSWTYFVNSFIMGDQYTELFTTRYTPATQPKSNADATVITLSGATN